MVRDPSTVTSMSNYKPKGKTVVDAVKPLNTTITAEDNAKAVPTDPTQCAIAQSTRRAKGVIEVSIGASMAYVTFAKEPNKIYRYALPANERALIRSFDKVGVFPCPFPVHLLPPPATRLLGARAGKPSGSNKRSGTGNNALQQARRKQPTRHVAAPA